MHTLYTKYIYIISEEKFQRPFLYLFLYLFVCIFYDVYVYSTHPNNPELKRPRRKKRPKEIISTHATVTRFVVVVVIVVVLQNSPFFVQFCFSRARGKINSYKVHLKICSTLVWQHVEKKKKN